MFKRNNRVLDFVYLISDTLIIISGFVLSYILRVNFDSRPLLTPVYARDFLVSTLIITPFWIIIFATLGLYSPKFARRPFRIIWRITFGCLIGIMALISLAFVFELTIFPARLVILYALAITTLSLIISRLIILKIFNLISHRNPSRIVLVGNSVVASDIAKQIILSTDNKLIATLGVKTDNVQSFSTTDELLEKLGRLKPDAIIQTDGNDDLRILTAAQKHFIGYNFIAASPELYAQSNISTVNWGYPIITVSPTPLIGWNVILKRIIDLIIIFILSPIWIPLMLILILGQKIFNPGPVFFKQTRLGRYGKPFQFYKFRSMVPKYSGQDAISIFKKMGREDLAEEYIKTRKITNDPRINAPMGKFLRATSLDELPQIMHILSGKMTLVGPRPILPDEKEFYKSKSSLLFAVKPGLTSLASVSGRSDLPFVERVKLELYYVTNWSLFFDFKILLLTIKAVILRTGSY